MVLSQIFKSCKQKPRKNLDKEFANQLDFNSVKFPFHKKNYTKIEKNISINVFGYGDKTPCYIYTLKQTFAKHVDLLLLPDSKNSHYVLMKDFDRFINNKANHLGKKYFSRYCLQRFSSAKVLECQVKSCLAINHAKSVLLPEENEYVNFQD